MDLDTFIVVIYCLVDELMGESLPDGERLCARGPDPLLEDLEVLTMEVVGAFLGIHTTRGSTPTSAGTTPSGSPRCKGYMARCSRVRRPTSERSKNCSGRCCSNGSGTTRRSLKSTPSP